MADPAAGIPAPSRPQRPASWLRDAERVDLAVYDAITRTPTPGLDRAMRRLTQAADHSKLWLAVSAMLAATRGTRGRRAAGRGIASVAVTSAVVNLLIKPLGRRRRPDRREVPASRRAPMPSSSSFPSGHSASAFAFASAVGSRPSSRGDPDPGARGSRRILARPHRRALSSRRHRRSAHWRRARAGDHPHARPLAGKSRPFMTFQLEVRSRSWNARTRSVTPFSSAQIPAKISSV